MHLEEGSVGCLLFIISFAAVGTAATYVYVSDLVNWARMQYWDEVPALIRSASLDAGRSKGGRSTIYRAHAEYEYEYQGRKYTNTRVSRYFGQDNMGRFHQDIYDELKKYESPSLSLRPQKSNRSRKVECIIAGA